MLWVPLTLVQHLSDIEQTFDVDAGQTLLRRLTSHVSDMWRYRSMQHWFYLSAIHFKLIYDKPCVNVGREQPENYVCQTLAPFDGVQLRTTKHTNFRHHERLIFPETTKGEKPLF